MRPESNRGSFDVKSGKAIARRTDLPYILASGGDYLYAVTTAPFPQIKVVTPKQQWRQSKVLEAHTIVRACGFFSLLTPSWYGAILPEIDASGVQLFPQIDE